MDQRAIDWGRNRTTISIERLEQLHASEKERDEMADEIKWLRAQNDKLRGWLDEYRPVIEAYQTPNVDNITIKGEVK